MRTKELERTSAAQAKQLADDLRSTAVHGYGVARHALADAGGHAREWIGEIETAPAVTAALGLARRYPGTLLVVTGVALLFGLTRRAAKRPEATR